MRDIKYIRYSIEIWKRKFGKIFIRCVIWALGRALPGKKELRLSAALCQVKILGSGYIGEGVLEARQHALSLSIDVNGEVSEATANVMVGVASQLGREKGTFSEDETYIQTYIDAGRIYENLSAPIKKRLLIQLRLCEAYERESRRVIATKLYIWNPPLEEIVSLSRESEELRGRLLKCIEHGLLALSMMRSVGGAMGRDEKHLLSRIAISHAFLGNRKEASCWHDACEELARREAAVELAAEVGDGAFDGLPSVEQAAEIGDRASGWGMPNYFPRDKDQA